MGELLQHRLRDATEDCSAVHEVRGRGLLIGLDLSGTPTETVDAVLDGVREQGVLIGSTGARFDVLKIRPPLVVTQPQVERIAEVVADVVARTVS
jgi:4-aminobutyrate aminotransferase